MIKQILVAIDFSTESVHAARYATSELAPQLQAEVTFVAVLEPSDLRVAIGAGLHGFENDEDVRRQVREWVEEQFREIEAPANAVNAKRDLRRGDPAHELIKAIAEHKADLVVIGACGIGRRDPIGTKAEHLLRHSQVPVLLVR
jgi:nucleotide-binding universal stress UspA family protein